MAVSPIPEGFHTVTPYLLTTNGGGLIEFMKKAFGAVEKYRTTLPDGRLMHATVQIGTSHIMLGEPAGTWQPTNAFLHLYVPDVDATYRQALAAGAQSISEPKNEFYGDRTAGVKDSFGNLWWIATHVEDVSHEEMERRRDAMARK